MLFILLLPLLFCATLPSSEITFSTNACIAGNLTVSLPSLKITNILKGSNLFITIKTFTGITDTFQYGTEGTESTIYLTLPQEEDSFDNTIIEQLFYNVETGAIYKKTTIIKQNKTGRKRLLSLAKKIKKALYQFKKKLPS